LPTASGKLFPLEIHVITNAGPSPSVRRQYFSRPFFSGAERVSFHFEAKQLLLSRYAFSFFGKAAKLCVSLCRGQTLSRKADRTRPLFSPLRGRLNSRPNGKFKVRAETHGVQLTKPLTFSLSR
jgi:hypothetical protein